MYVCMYIYISGIKPIEHHTETHSRNRTKLLTTRKEQNSTHKHKHQIEQNYPEKNRATDDYRYVCELKDTTVCLCATDGKPKLFIFSINKDKLRP